MILLGFQGKPFNITVIQVYAPTINAKEDEQFYEDLQDLLELTPKKKKVLFITGNWNAKVGIQEIPGVTGNLALEYKVKQGKGNRVLPREYTGHSKYPLPTTQETTLHMGITIWTKLKSNDYILCSQRRRSSIWSAKTRPGADWGLDHELLIAKFRLN